jgi:aminopeptidase N
MAREAVVSHELAHQWFGDDVSLKNWEDIWLKEGSATYLEWMWSTRFEGLPGMNRLVGERLARLPVEAVAQPPVDELYIQEVYDGGALVLHALRLKVGDDLFFRIMRTYHERYAGGSAGTDDFIALVRELAGADTAAALHKWLYKVGQPEMPGLS